MTENKDMEMQQEVCEELPVEDIPCEEKTEVIEETVAQEEEREEKEESPEEKPETQEEVTAQDNCDDEEVKVYTPHEKKVEEPAPVSEKKTGENNRVEISPAVQYRKSVEREKKISQEVRKRQRRPMVFILIMCVLLIIIAIIANAVIKDSNPGYNPPPPTADTQVVETPIPTLAPQPVVVATPAPRVASYEVYVEDISWEAARDKCAQMGGRLAVINDETEFNMVMEAVKGCKADKLWIGCFKFDGAIVWMDGEASSYYPWAANEPSGYDSYDGSPEDYIMLSKYNDGWKYNDSRNDPAGDFPQWYRGTIGYICEYN